MHPHNANGVMNHGMYPSISSHYSWSNHHIPLHKIIIYVFRSYTLNTTDDSEHIYLFSVCRDGITCEGDPVMVGQYGTGAASGRCFILGRWNASISPAYYDPSNGGQWSFIYNNGILSIEQNYLIFSWLKTVFKHNIFRWWWLYIRIWSKNMDSNIHL